MKSSYHNNGRKLNGFAEWVVGQFPVTSLVRTYRPICGIGSRLGEANFRFARQPPTIVTWAELDFYDLPLIRPSGFVNSGRQGFSNQELGELRMDRRGYGNSSEAIPFLLSYRIDMLSRLKRRGVKTLEIELVQTKELAYGVSGSR